MEKNIKLLNKKEVSEVLDILSKEYANVTCGLKFNNLYELIIALILAAQCTDERVNIIRPCLTKKYPNFKSLSFATQKDIYEIIKSCSFPNNKAQHILNAAKYIANDLNGIIPNTMETLTKIPGIGRKSANIILSDYYKTPVGIAIDTHAKRLSKRIGFSKNDDVLMIEKDLLKKVPKNLYSSMNHILVNHGQKVCNARKPDCSNCIINSICKKNAVI